jgi:hypothetical protein
MAPLFDVKLYLPGTIGFCLLLDRADLVGLAPATIATHLDGVRDGRLLASYLLALAVTNVSFGNGTANQSGNSRSNEKRFLSFIHNFVRSILF